MLPRSGDDGLMERTLRAHAYWNLLGFKARVAFLAPGGIDEKRWVGLLEGVKDAHLCSFLNTDHLSPDAQVSLLRHARLIHKSGSGPVEWLDAPAQPVKYHPLRSIGSAKRAAVPTLLNNGRGGFSPDGQEYILQIDPLADGHPDLPPMPWSNVIANEHFGFLTTERGSSCIWNQNSRLHRLTPWLNDPVGDPLPEALYLRDEDSQEFWSPTPGPAGKGLGFTVRHGFGYTRWESVANGLEQEVTVFAPLDEPLKLTRLKLRNTGSRRRRLSLFWYAHLVLGETPEKTAGLVDTIQDGKSLFAWNVTPNALGGQVAFAALAPKTGPQSFTTDRGGFLGRHGSMEGPEAVLCLPTLDGVVGPGQDPCFAFQMPLDLEPGETLECVVVFGEAKNQEDAQRFIAKYAEVPAAEAALAEVRSFWRSTLSGIQIQTPEPAIDMMVNGWLPYQNLTCRMWGRTAYYQSGGAFGYRDQLQDASALLYLLPGLTRDQLLLHAAHQFSEGDVLHWWHPPIEEGIRTQFSDDLLWLPYVTAFYLQSTGDWDVLAEQVPYLTARLLEDGEDETYLAPKVSSEQGDLYDHCCRAMDRSLGRMGAHGLPLMGTGDWNDGMNRVGRKGKGESVWMGFFLFTILDSFVPLCERRGDAPRAARYAAEKARLSKALDETSWDGEWYRRAYYDDGTPLGSAANQECRIDCLSQAWATISKAVPEERALKALQAMEKYLIDDEAGMIRLLTPAFDVCENDPGYIKGYIPGVRENGGQYTHGVLWAIRAVAEAGWTDRAAALLTMLSPATRAGNPGGVATYQTEPYVVAADVYGVAPLVGRGGWTWYTGSAGWMYRVAVEDVLGFHLHEGHAIRLRPRLPSTWDHTTLRYRHPGTKSVYEIRVVRDSAKKGGIQEVILDGQAMAPGRDEILVPIIGDGRMHTLRVVIGA
jgi:N,N'-diacetylchitobiose phosphorylase